MAKFIPTLDDETLRNLVDALTKSGQAVSIYDAEDNLRYANETYQSIFMGEFEGPYTFQAILRYAARQGLGVRIDGEDVEALIDRTLPRRRSVARKSFESDLADGRWFWFDHTVLPSGWILSIAADVTALKHNEKSLRQAHEAAILASQVDPLTGLPNRRRIIELLDHALAVRNASDDHLCAAFIDIDKFKDINDTYGHESGDAVLQHFAGACCDRLRQQDHLGRIGGEEFLLLLPGVTLEEALSLIERIKADFPPACVTDAGLKLPCLFSIGLTEVTGEDSPTSVLSRADQAMYAAKARGGNCIQVR
jgi:diguanylate cyclase (GGDEF)-like protein